MVSLTLLLDSELQVTACLHGLPRKGWLAANEKGAQNLFYMLQNILQKGKTNFET